MALNSSVNVPSTFPSTQLLGLEMLLHYFLGPEAVAAAAKRRLTLSLGESHMWSMCLSQFSQVKVRYFLPLLCYVLNSPNATGVCEHKT